MSGECSKCGFDCYGLDCYVCGLTERLGAAEDILRKATAPRRPDGTYNYSREAFEQMANDYFAATGMKA